MAGTKAKRKMAVDAMPMLRGENLMTCVLCQKEVVVGCLKVKVFLEVKRLDFTNRGNLRADLRASDYLVRITNERNDANAGNG